MSVPTRQEPQRSTPGVLKPPTPARERRTRLPGLPHLSTVGCKTVMALTGLVFTAFVAVHMVGNLKVYLGAAHFDDYAHWLRTLLEPLLPYEGVLWILRAVLVVSLLAHVGCALVLGSRARRARGPFRRKGLRWRSFSARSMPVTGVVLLLFVIFHVLDLTLGTHPVASTGFRTGSATASPAYENLLASFQRPAVSVFYVAAMVVLGLHLLHGLWTVVNDLGATGARVRQVALVAGGILAGAVFVGNTSIPIAVMTGMLR